MKKVATLVLLVLAFAFAIALAPAAEAAPPGPTIVDVASDVNEKTGEFSILLAAVAADPVVYNTLNGNGQFTVFAPTDAAFAALAEDLAEDGIELTDLLGTPELRQILLYHVARGERDSGDVLSSDRIRTMNRAFIFQDGGVLNDGQATIVMPDVDAANGVIHVIDGVLLP